MFTNIPMLNSLSDLDKKNLEGFVQSRYLAEGEVLFNEGESGNSLYFVTDGKLEVNSNGKILGYIEPGDIVGEMSIFGSEGLRSATVKAAVKTQILVIMGFSIKEIGSSDPDLLENLKNIINQRKSQNNS